MSVTVTGLAELKAGIQALPATVQARLQTVARNTAGRIREGARARVPVDSGITRDSIRFIEDFPNRQFIVEVGPAPRQGRTANFGMLPVWIEYGTRFQVARPFMRPAADAESDRYVREMTAAAEDAVRKALT